MEAEQYRLSTKMAVKAARETKIQSHSFLCEGITIEDGVFVGHGVMFINDIYPQATNIDGSLVRYGDWTLAPTIVKRGASLGSNSTM